MIKSIYIETTIPSFYYETRTEPEMVARRNWTRDWWNNHRKSHSLATSEAVLNELEEGDFPNKKKKIELVSELDIVEITEDIIDIVEVYIQQHVMPRDPTGDALHLALASWHKFDFLLTWNCEHLANANKFDHIRRINTLLGLFTPVLITPLALLTKDATDGT